MRCFFPWIIDKSFHFLDSSQRIRLQADTLYPRLCHSFGFTYNTVIFKLNLHTH